MAICCRTWKFKIKSYVIFFKHRVSCFRRAMQSRVSSESSQTTEDSRMLYCGQINISCLLMLRRVQEKNDEWKSITSQSYGFFLSHFPFLFSFSVLFATLIHKFIFLFFPFCSWTMKGNRINNSYVKQNCMYSFEKFRSLFKDQRSFVLFSSQNHFFLHWGKLFTVRTLRAHTRAAEWKLKMFLAHFELFSPTEHISALFVLCASWKCLSWVLWELRSRSSTFLWLAPSKDDLDV